MAQKSDLMFPKAYRNVVSITTVMNDKYYVAHDGRSFFDVRESESNRLLRRIDLELGDIISVFQLINLIMLFLFLKAT